MLYNISLSVPLSTALISGYKHRKFGVGKHPRKPLSLYYTMMRLYLYIPCILLEINILQTLAPTSNQLMIYDKIMVFFFSLLPRSSCHFEYVI